MNLDLSGRRMVLVPVAAVLFLALFPQIFFMLTHAGAWNGSYFVSNYDETAYSAYVNSLIEGGPRKNDPFLGLADSDQTPQPETLYSIQFIPPYAIALPARFLGLSVSTAFIILAAAIAVFSALAIYLLLLAATRDTLISIVGPVVVLCLGTAVAFQGELRDLIDGRLLADFFPFLRRYQPGFSFPLFFVFCLLVYDAINAQTVRRLAALAAGAGGVFAILVFSYYFLWTAAAAWLMCFVLGSVITKRAATRKVLTAAGVIAAMGTAALIPYFILLSQRSANLDSVQLLDLTHMPNVASPSMIVGLIVAGAAFLINANNKAKSDGRFPLVLSLALTPVILFNQQVFTGRSLQPVHYELFIANYIVLTAAMILLSVWRDSRTIADKPAPFAKALVYLGVAAFTWGLFEAYGSTTRAFTVADIRDASIPALKAAANDQTRPQTVLATNFVTADFIPSVGNSRSFWNPHTSSAGGIGVDENKRHFYRFLYFSGYTSGNLDAALRANSFEVSAAIFGSERALPSLASTAKKITPDEIHAETAKFENFTAAFDASQAYDPSIDHIIVPAEAEPSFANLDRWYQRDAGETFGLFKLYRLTPKTAR